MKKCAVLKDGGGVNLNRKVVKTNIMGELKICKFGLLNRSVYLNVQKKYYQQIALTSLLIYKDKYALVHDLLFSSNIKYFRIIIDLLPLGPEDMSNPVLYSTFV